MSVIIYLFIVINKMGYEYSSMGFPVWKHEKCLPVLKDNCGVVCGAAPGEVNAPGQHPDSHPASLKCGLTPGLLLLFVCMFGCELESCSRAFVAATGVLIKILKSIKTASGLLWLCCNNETR